MELLPGWSLGSSDEFQSRNSCLEMVADLSNTWRTGFSDLWEWWGSVLEFKTQIWWNWEDYNCKWIKHSKQCSAAFWLSGSNLIWCLKNGAWLQCHWIHHSDFGDFQLSCIKFDIVTGRWSRDVSPHCRSCFGTSETPRCLEFWREAKGDGSPNWENQDHVVVGVGIDGLELGLTVWSWSPKCSPQQFGSEQQ